jgi:signal transduction histidine kinase
MDTSIAGIPGVNCTATHAAVRAPPDIEVLYHRRKHETVASMKVSASEQSGLDHECQHAARADELAELMGHLIACWDEERRQLARRLHDSLGSSMTALTMHLAMLSQQLAEEPQRDRAGQMKQLLGNIIETNRKMQLALWNDKLEFLGPKAAIAELVADWGREQGLMARASLPDEDPVYSRAQGVALLRCAEEGLRNVAAHARASEVEVILDDDGDQAMLTVRDNGVGPGDGSAAGSVHCHGLRLLRERVRPLNGRLTLGPGPDGKGTALTLVLPRVG